MAWFDEIATPSALIVFLVAVVLTGAARFGFGPRRASLGPALVVPLAVFAVAGPPNFLTESLVDQISILALAGFVLGAFLDLEHFDLWPRRAMIIVAPFAGLAWMIVRAGQLDMIEADRNFILAVLTGSLIATVRVGRMSGSAMTAPIQLATTAIGLSLLAWIGGEPALAQISAVIGLGLAGFFVWNWPLFRYPPPARLLLLARPSRWRQQMGRWCWRTGFQAPVSPSWASFFSVIGRCDLYLWAAAAWPAPCGRCWSSPSPPW